MNIRENEVAAKADPAEALELLFRSRGSCRAYLADPVADSVIERMLGIAQHTPSWCNVQPWQADVTKPPVTGRVAELLYDAARSGAPPASALPLPQGYPDVYDQRRKDCGWGLYARLGIAREDREARLVQSLENFRFFGAPHVALISSPSALGPYGVLDCGGYVTALLLAAQAVGLAAVPQAAIAFHPAILRKELGIGDDRDILCGIAFGYADVDHPAHMAPMDRAPLSAAVRWHGG